MQINDKRFSISETSVRKFSRDQVIHQENLSSFYACTPHGLKAQANFSILSWMHRWMGCSATVDTPSSLTMRTASRTVGEETGRVVSSAGERGLGMMCSCPL